MTFFARALVACALVGAGFAAAPSAALAVPPAPTVIATSPASPANDNSPEVLGSAAAGSVVGIYANATCMGLPLAVGSAAEFANPGITVTVANNSSTTFYATASDTDGPSPCSASAITYSEVSPAPAAPVIVDTDPPSPSSVNAPKFRGTAAAGTTVALYVDNACLTEPVGLGTAAQFASPGITVQVGDNSATTIWARAFDGATPSACSTTAVSYLHRLPAPAPPVFTDSDPDSPSNNNVPFIKGSAAAGGVVRLYANATCIGARFGEGLTASFASPGLQTSVLNDATTTLYATVTNAAGTTSACSTSSLTYVEDSTPPQTTIASGPASTVVAGSTVRFEFSSSEPGSRFECHLHVPGFQPCISPASFPALAAGTSAGSRTLQVRAIDRAGNEDGSPATRSYAVTAKPPPPPPPPGCTLRVAAIVGNAAANTIDGTTRSDVIFGRAGNDCLYGEAGSDRLRGGSGGDRLLGGPGADRLEGESGNDRMTGAAGNDRLTDRSGRDTFSGGAGNDRIDARDTSLAGRRVRDTVRCGTGTRDVALADRRDLVLRDCERVALR